MFATKVPAAGELWLNFGVLAIEYGRRLENSSLRLDHVAIDLQTIILQVSVASPVQQAQPVQKLRVRSS